MGDDFKNPFSDSSSHNPFASPYASGPKMGPPGRSNSLAIWSLVLGIVSLTMLPIFCCCLPLGIANVIVSSIGGVCGWIAYSQAQRGEAEGAGMALAGMITSGIALVLSLGFFLLVVLAMVTA